MTGCGLLWWINRDSLPMSINSFCSYYCCKLNISSFIKLIHFKFKKLLWEEDGVANPYRRYTEAFVKGITWQFQVAQRCRV